MLTRLAPPALALLGVVLASGHPVKTAQANSLPQAVASGPAADILTRADKATLSLTNNLAASEVAARKNLAGIESCMDRLAAIQKTAQAMETIRRADDIVVPKGLAKLLSDWNKDCRAEEK